MGSLSGSLIMPLGGDPVTATICNPSRGGATPLTTGDPVGVKALDGIRVSIKEAASFVDLGTIQMNIGFAKIHTTGTDFYDRILARTKRGSLYLPTGFNSEPTLSCISPQVTITKTSNNPQPSTYFTSLDGGTGRRKSAMVSAIMQPLVTPAFAPGATDPVGPVLGLEIGPRQTAVYLFFVTDPVNGNTLRICGPAVNGVRVPDIRNILTWSVATQYFIFWSEERQDVQIYVDSSDGLGGFNTATLLATVPISSFQSFGAIGTVPAGGTNDYTAIYGVEGVSTTSVEFSGISLATDAGFPFINGARPGGWKTFLDSDLTVGFSGGVDPTKQSRGGAWFLVSGGDPLGTLTPSVSGGYCRLQKKTPATFYALFRDEPGFERATDGIVVEFKVNADLTGGTGFATGAALQIYDGLTLFQLDFLYDGNVHNIGLLKAGGDPNSPSSHYTATSPIDWSTKTLRLVIDPRRQKIDVYDVTDLVTPIATWPFSRAALPTTTDMAIVIGLPGDTTNAVGAFDIYSLKYSYVYQAWESFDSITPLAADPPYTSGATAAGGPLNETVMPGVSPIPYSIGTGGAGSGALTADGYQVTCTGGQTFFLSRDGTGLIDTNRGAIFEGTLKITSWHPGTRTGAFVVMDDGLNAWMLSFIDTPSGKFVSVPLSAGVGQFQEYGSKIGDWAKISSPVDWTQFHTYRFERRPRDGVYLYIDNAQVLVMPDSVRYSFPTTQFSGPKVGFGQLTDEGGTSVWKSARFFFGSGYEIGTVLDDSQSDIIARVGNTRTSIVITAGV